MKKINKEWVAIVAIRAIKTMAQTAMGMITVGAALNEVEWVQIVSVALVSAVYSILTSISTGVETEESRAKDGLLLIDDAEEHWHLDLVDNLGDLKDRKAVTIRVAPNMDLTDIPKSRQ